MNNTKLTLYYAICRYVPDPINHKSLNIGIVYHIPQKKVSRFYHVKSKKKLLTFDGKCDLTIIDTMYASLSYVFDNSNSQLTKDLDNYFPDISDNAFLFARTKYYVNTFRFSPIYSKQVTLKNLDNSIILLKRKFLS